MKYLKLLNPKILVTLWMGVLLPLTAGADGNSTGGGGSITLASAQEIRQTIRSLFASSEGETPFLWIEQNLHHVSDGELRSIFEKMVVKGRAPQTVFEDIRKTPYRIEETRPCKGPEGERQASVRQNRINSPICFSIPLLKLPKARLKQNLRALFAHELAHHYGATESQAKKVEEYLNNWVSRPEPAAGLGHISERTVSAIRKLIDGLKNGSVAQSQVCMELGQINGMRVAFQEMLVALNTAQFDGDDYGVKPDSVAASYRTFEREENMMRLCKSGSISDSGRKELINALEDHVTDVQKLNHAAPAQ